MATSQANLHRSESPTIFTFEFTLEIPEGTSGTHTIQRNYKETLQGANTGDRLQAMQVRVKSAIEAVASELGTESSKIKCVTTKKDGTYIEIPEFFPQTPKLIPQIVIDRAIINSNHVTEVESFNIEASTDQGLLQPATVTGNSSLLRSSSTLLPRLWSDEQIFDEGNSDDGSLYDQLIPILKEMQTQVRAIEGRDGVTSEDKLEFYQEKRVECSELIQELINHFSGGSKIDEIDDIERMDHWFYFHEIQNTPNVTFATWKQIDRYLSGLKEEICHFLGDTQGKKIVKDLVAFFELDDDFTEIKKQIVASQSEIAQNQESEQLERLQKKLEILQNEANGIEKQITALKAKILMERPIEMAPIWDTCVNAFLLKNRIVILDKAHMYVPAALRFELFNAMKGICQSNHVSPFEFKKELFSGKLVEQQQNEPKLFSSFSQMFIETLSDEIGLGNCCNVLDQVALHFVGFYELSANGNGSEDALVLAIGKVIKDAAVARKIASVFQRLSELTNLQERMATLQQKWQLVIPENHRLLNPVTIQNRGQLLVQLEEIKQEIDAIQATNLTRFCSRESINGFNRLLTLFAFCKIQIKMPPALTTTQPFIDAYNNYLDVITEGKWKSSLFTTRREAMFQLSADIAAVKSQEEYQNLTDASALAPSIEKMQKSLDLQRHLLERTVIGDSWEIKAWVRAFLEFQCKLAEKTELTRLRITDDSLSDSVVQLRCYLSPIQFSSK